MLRLVITLLLVLSAPQIHSRDLGNQFVTARLAHGVAVDIPRSWYVFQGTEMAAIETAVGAAIDLTGQTRMAQGGEILILASFPDQNLYSGLTITSLAIAGMRSDFANSVSVPELKSSEASLRQGVEVSQARLGTKVFGWTSLQKDALGKYVILRTSYVRTSDAGDTRVQLYKFFTKGHVIDVALSTRIANERLNKPILDRILQSIVVPN